MNNSFTILLDFKNEANNIKPLLERLKNIFLNQRFYKYKKSVFFINDKSTDNSVSIIEESKEKYKNIFKIVLFNTPFSFGRDTCKLYGFRKINSSFLIHLDSDLQDPPEVIPYLIDKWEQGSKIVFTVRKKRKGENRMKLFLTFVAYRIVKLISGSKRPLDSGDFTLIDKDIYKKIAKIQQYDPYIKGLLGLINAKSSYVKYEREARYTGKTKYPLNGSLNPYREICRATIMYSKRILPIYFFFSFFFFLMSCGYFMFNGLNFSFTTLTILFFNIMLFGILIFLTKYDEKFQEKISLDSLDD